MWARRRRPGRRGAAVPALRLHVPARGATTKEEALALAPTRPGWSAPTRSLLHPDPYPSRRGLVRGPARRRPSAGWPRCDPALPTVLVNHFPLVREPTRVLRYPEFAQWCGTDRTADWHAPVPRGRRGLRPPAHPADHLARRGPLRGGLARLPARVAGPVPAAPRLPPPVSGPAAR